VEAAFFQSTQANEPRHKVLSVDLATPRLSERADIFVDDRPRATVDLVGPTTSVAVNAGPGAASVRVDGYSEGLLAAARTVAL
jgi:hypothetical protein